MNRLFLIGCALMMLFSCEKKLLEDEEEFEEAQANLIINVFEMEQMPFAPLRTAASEVCTRLNFAIYDVDRNRVKQINQQVVDEHFGTAYFLLPEGDYQVVVVAHSSDGNPTMTDPTRVQFKNSQGFTDTFLYSHETTLTDQQQTLNASLDRIVALCRFVITDDYPEQVAKMRFYYTGGSGAFNAYTGLGSVNSKQEMTFDVSAGQKQFDLYTFLHDTEGTIHLKVTALDAQDQELDEREFDVPLKRNFISKVSGPYFDQSGAQNTIEIEINTEWDGEIDLTF
ncbi:MAG: FimB/Mfa2 family fimbrial subunit [Prevotella sp.]|nr:FimB/Mfa2 family fimbrial subunit [Prevotella sp.]